MIPYDLSRLWLYVSGVAFVYVVSTATASGQHVLGLLGMTLCTWLAYIVYGASPTENQWHTLAAAFYLMLLIQWDPPVWTNDEQDKTMSCSLNALQRLSLASSRTILTNLSVADRLAVVQTRSVLGLTMALHILRLYDRGWQPQRWPVPTILGASFGWIAGIWIGLVLETIRLARLGPSDNGNNKGKR